AARCLCGASFALSNFTLDSNTPKTRARRVTLQSRKQAMDSHAVHRLQTGCTGCEPIETPTIMALCSEQSMAGSTDGRRHIQLRRGSEE
ncbi:MAG: hypothetical protein WA045_07620, partial [Nitrospira sp.]